MRSEDAPGVNLDLCMDVVYFKTRFAVYIMIMNVVFQV
jgi:hypothetical protein